MGQRPKLLLNVASPEDQTFISRPVGFRSNGDPFFMIAGGSGEDDDDDDDDSGGVDTNGATVPIGKFLKTQNRMKAADRRANDLQAKLTAAEEIAAKVPELEKQVEAHKGTINQLRIDNAFLTSTDIEWQDPEVALRLVDLSKVTIGDDGKVNGLADALKELAEKRPFLVKEKKAQGQEDDGDDEDENDDDADDQDAPEEGTSGADKGGQNGAQGGGVSGTSTGSGKRRKRSNGPTDAELMARYRI